MACHALLCAAGRSSREQRCLAVYRRKPDFFYRYYYLGATNDLATLPISPKPAGEDSPFFVVCLKGCQVDEAGCADDASDGYTEDYVPEELSGLVATYTILDVTEWATEEEAEEAEAESNDSAGTPQPQR